MRPRTWRTIVAASRGGIGTPVNVAIEAAPVAIFHGDVGLAARGTDVEDRHYVRIADASGGLRLAAKAGQLRVAGAVAGPEQLEGDNTVELRVERLERDADASLAEDRE